MFFVLLWFTVLAQRPKAVLPLGADNKQDFPSKKQDPSLGGTFHLSGQSSADFTEPVTGGRAESAAGTYNTQHDEIRHYPKRRTTRGCSASTASAAQQSPNSSESLGPTQSLPAGCDPAPSGWRHAGTSHGGALLLRPCECFWLCAPF